MLKPITGVSSYIVPKSITNLAKTVCNSLSKEYQVRTNAIQGINGCFDVPNSLLYLPNNEYMGLTASLPEPPEAVMLWANQIIIKMLPYLDHSDLSNLRKNVYCLLGYNTGRPSEFVMYYKSSKKHNLDKLGINFILKLAEEYGIPSYNIDSANDLRTLRTIKEQIK